MKRFCSHFLITLFFLIPCNLLGNEIIFEYETKNQVNLQDLISAMHNADIILLGEIHDNLFQHRARADLIGKLQSEKFVIVSEHLSSGNEITYSGSLLEDLEIIGFNKKSWSWPVHEVLYKKFEELSLPVFGGNLSHEDINNIYLGKKFSLSDTLNPLVDKSVLNSQSKDKLINDLVAGHCGVVEGDLLSFMFKVQRYRDASLAQIATAVAPAIVIAGNGHVRRDYGVPQILKKINPSSHVVSIAFLEIDRLFETTDSVIKKLFKDADTDYIWLTEAVSREDPCENLLGRGD
ncbi:ChaN family lipoprotein [Betaproteobacteria bacterium]|nr:ChaN family lipoprotein [Betaproteobacteria bacterium]